MLFHRYHTASTKPALSEFKTSDLCDCVLVMQCLSNANAHFHSFIRPTIGLMIRIMQHLDPKKMHYLHIYQIIIKKGEDAF